MYYTNDVQKEEEASFKISAYNMKLTINRQLQNDVCINLDGKEPLSTYKFTLYRNYKIEKILGKNNEILEYKRSGDYLEIINPTNAKMEQIRILYSGYSPVFYSNSQGVLLPGCFPYYPMEGYKKIYIKQESRFIPIIRDYNVKFDVSIKSNLSIYSNLEKDNNKFSGEAQELTLMGGLLEEKNVANNTFYGLVLEKMDTNLFLSIDEVLNSYKKIISENEELNIKNKKIFQSPVTFSYRVIGNGVVSFKDHVFVSTLNKEQLALFLIQSNLPQDIKKREINSTLFIHLLDKNRLTNIPKDDLENNPSLEVTKLFLNKINELGEDYVIKSTYKFLKDKNDKRDSITFIKNLSK